MELRRGESWLLYGAYGYTGEMIAELAVKRGLQPILAGRNSEKLQPLAERLGLQWRSFALDNATATAAGLNGVSTVLNCAGPFSKTAEPMLSACLRGRVNYLDVTGEIEVFEDILGKKAAAIKEAGISVIPGVGFDVVPTDCLAAMVANDLAAAETLRLGFSAKLRASPGTVKTAIESLHKNGKVRRDGRIQDLPFDVGVRKIRFRSDRESLAVAIPWGDIASAYYSTGIPNIETFMAAPRGQIRAMRTLARLRPIVSLGFVQRGLKKLVDLFVKGEGASTRSGGYALVWAQAIDHQGKTIERRLKTPNPYTLTAETALASVERVLAGGIAKGALTPSKAFGRDFILEFEGVELIP